MNSEMPLIDIRSDHWAIVRNILQKHVPQYAVWAFGSRAKWTAKEYSDLDLAIITDKPLPLSISAALDEDFSESDLPWKVDVVDWATTSEAFRKIIAQDKVVVQTPHCGSGWHETTLGEVIELKRGYDLPQKQRLPGSVPLVSSSGVSDTHAEAMVKGPGVVTGRYGTIGQVFYIEEDFWPLNTTLYVRDFKGNDPRFVGYFLRNIDFLAYSDKAAVPGVNRNDLHQAKIRFPADIEEQRAIAHILGTLDDKIELNRQQNKTLEEMARALFKAWFVDFEPVRAKMEGRWRPGQSLPGLPAPLYDLFPDRLIETELGEIPEGWRMSDIKDCCMQVQNGGTPRRSENLFWEGGTIPWLTSGEVRQTIIAHTDSFITEAGLRGSSAKWIPALSTVVALYGATAGQVSLASFPLTTNQAVCALIPKDGFSYFNYLSMRNAVAEMEGKAVGSAQQNISKGIVEKIKVAYAPAMLMEKFSLMVEPFFDKWIANLRQSRTLAQLCDTLLPKLISGELRVPDAEAFLGERGL